MCAMSRGSFLGVLLMLGGMLSLRAQPAIRAELDQGGFRYDSTQAYLELYTAVEAASLRFLPRAEGPGFVARLSLELEIFKGPERVLEDRWRLEVPVDSLEQLRAGQQVLDVYRFLLPPGAYQLRLWVRDEADPTDRRQLLERDLLVPDFAQPLPRSSTLLLAGRIERSEETGHRFYRNGLLIYPNPSALFGSTLNTLYYYVELYHLDRTPRLASGEYEALVYLSEANSERALEAYTRRQMRAVRPVDVLVGGFDVGGLPTGVYVLHVAALDPDRRPVIIASRRVYVYNPDVRPPQVAADQAPERDFASSVFARMDEHELQRSFEYANPIATENERRTFRRLRDIEEKRRFLYEFWLRRDPDPATPLNEAYQEYMNRVRYVNERYSTKNREGWRTDRGRIYLKYGPPNTIQPYYHNPDTVPYEIWEYYNIPGEGPGMFVFADKMGFGEFQLIHSTVSGEVKSADWQREVRRSVSNNPPY